MSSKQQAWSRTPTHGRATLTCACQVTWEVAVGYAHMLRLHQSCHTRLHQKISWKATHVVSRTTVLQLRGMKLKSCAH